MRVMAMDINRKATRMFLLAFVGVFTIALAFSCFSSKKDESAQKSDINGGFEEQEGTLGHPRGWIATRLPETVDHVDFQWDGQIMHSGRRSVSIDIKPSHPLDTIAYNWTRLVTDFEVDSVYELTGWIKTQNLKETAFIVAQFWDSSRVGLVGMATTQNVSPVVGTEDWTMVKTEFQVPENTAIIRIRAGIATPANIGGKVWFDDIDIAKK
jgi:hypothetical protein